MAEPKVKNIGIHTRGEANTAEKAPFCDLLRPKRHIASACFHGELDMD